MTTLANRIARQHGFLVAMVSGLVVLAVSMVQSLLGGLIGLVGSFEAGGSQQWQWWPGYALQFGTVAIPFSIGVILSFWFIAPIGPDLHVVHVITRSVLASGVGAVLVFLTLLATSTVSLITTGLLGQIRFDEIAGDQWLHAVGSALATGGERFLTVAPLVILVGVLLRTWLERHPSEHGIVGIVDTA